MRNVLLGSPVVIHERFDPERLSAALDDGITHVSLVPTMLGRLLDWPQAARKRIAKANQTAVKALLEKLAPYDILISAATGGDRAVGPAPGLRRRAPGGGRGPGGGAVVSRPRRDPGRPAGGRRRCRWSQRWFH